MNIAGHLLVFLHGYVCGFRMKKSQGESHIPAGPLGLTTLHLIKYLASTALLPIQTIREDKQQGEWCFSFSLSLCFCVCVCLCVVCNLCTSHVQVVMYQWQQQMDIAGCIVGICVLVCVCVLCVISVRHLYRCLCISGNSK